MAIPSRNPERPSDGTDRFRGLSMPVIRRPEQNSRSLCRLRIRHLDWKFRLSIRNLSEDPRPRE